MHVRQRVGERGVLPGCEGMVGCEGLQGRQVGQAFRDVADATSLSAVMMRRTVRMSACGGGLRP